MWIDLVIVAAIVITAWISWHRGFFVILGRLLVFVVSLVLTLAALVPMRFLVHWLPFLQTWADRLNEKIVRPLLPVAGTLRDAILSLPLPLALQRILLGQFPDPDSPLVQAWPELADHLFQYALSAALFLLMLLILSLVIRVSMRTITRFLDRLPILGTLNHLGGLLVGLAMAGLVLLVLLLLVGLAAPYLPELLSWLRQSRIFSYLYAVNFLYTFTSLFFQVMAT